MDASHTISSGIEGQALPAEQLEPVEDEPMELTQDERGRGLDKTLFQDYRQPMEIASGSTGTEDEVTGYEDAIDSEESTASAVEEIDLISASEATSDDNESVIMLEDDNEGETTDTFGEDNSSTDMDESESVSASEEVGGAEGADPSGKKRGWLYMADKEENDELNTNFQEIVADVMKVARYVLPTVLEEPEEMDRCVTSLRTTLSTVLGAQERLNSASRIADKVAKDMNFDNKDFTNSLPVEDFLKLVDDYGKNAAKAMASQSIKRRLNKNKLYQKSLAELDSLSGNHSRPMGSTSPSTSASAVAGCSRDLEVLALTEYIPTRDPITLQFFKIIKVNTVCGHVYELESITELIRSSKTNGIKCPYAGCDNKQLVTIDCLKDDPKMAKKIANKIAKLVK